MPKAFYRQPVSIARHHAEWLSLLEISGPFVSMPVLLRIYPQGLEPLDAGIVSDLRAVYDEWLDNQQGARPDPAIHRAWVEWVLRNLLKMTDTVLRGPQDSALTTFSLQVTEQNETLCPDWAIVDPIKPQKGQQPVARLLVQLVPPAQGLEKPLTGHHWAASPATRMMELLHATGVRLGLVTNGEQWMLVHAPRGETTGYVSWYAALWLDESLTLRAFSSLIGAYRFFSVPDKETIEELLADSSNEQQEVTDQLGLQVRRAVELLVQAIDLADQDREQALLKNTAQQDLYEAAVTVMMRLVFLFSAEERGLLLLGDPIYDAHYAVSTLRAQLRESADQLGEEVLERRYDAWCRLMATFRAVHGGITHDRLRLPPYGGGLFDPDRYPFLEGRPAGSSWRTVPAEPLPINNRTVLHLLDALQMLRVQVPGGGPAEARRLSFRALDIEQIGHVYEGLLDHTALKADKVVLGLVGTKSHEPEILLPVLEEYRGKGESALVAFLEEETGRSGNALRNAFRATDGPLPTAAQTSLFINDVPASHSTRRSVRSMPQAPRFMPATLQIACGRNNDLYQRLTPYAALIREDDFGRPVVILPGSVYVTAGRERRATGTHYTPRSLTEPIVQHTLEPLVYRGPAEGLPRDKWRLRLAKELLRLKVCDMAMGSGALLVQACRYLSERLVEAWAEAENTSRKNVLHKSGRQEDTGQPQTSDPRPVTLLNVEGDPADHPDHAIPTDPNERLALARRLVADRCLYGVDKNPMAVEMAKLSLWLITLGKGQPFTFLDHALKCGDSLVGVSRQQLQYWTLHPDPKVLHAREFGTELDVEKVVALRREIAALPDRDIRDQELKAHKLAQAEALTHHLRTGGDLLIASYFSNTKGKDTEALRERLWHAFRAGADVPPETPDLAKVVPGGLRPFHWEIEFPEVFLAEGRKGFDAFVGNPPFMGGKRISSNLGDLYYHFLRTKWDHASGSADMCAYFFLGAFGNLRYGGFLGLIATNTIAQGGTREVGLDYLVSQGGTIYHATNSQRWPGDAAVVVDVIHVSRGLMQPPFSLDGQTVSYISGFLDSRQVQGSPQVLVANALKSHIGSVVLGLGFTMTPKEAQLLIARDPHNTEVLFPYLNGEDLNTRPDQSPSRWIINFHDWPLEIAQEYPDSLSIVLEKVKPQRDIVKRKVYREIWWQYAEKQRTLYRTIAPLRRVLVVAQTSRTLAFAFVPKGMVYAMMTIVFAFDETWAFTLLQSACHEMWVRKYASTLKQDVRYTPTDVFETFPFPNSTHLQRTVLDSIGEAYHEHRRQIMLARQEGLTKTYNRLHNPEEAAEDIARLRALHVQMDQAVATAYGWEDLDLGHEFHQTAQGMRYTLSEPARREVLRRLLELNYERHEEEVRQGLQGEKRGGQNTHKTSKQSQRDLF